ncbi:MAG: FtsQ-type POTRA domain-containing protein [Candidatus Sungiibacteriota bacterium]
MKSRIVYTPSGPAKKRREGKKIFLAVAIGAGILIVCGGIVFVLRAPRLQIQDIALSGIKILDEQAVRDRISAAFVGARALIFPRSSFFLADTDEIAYRLKQDFLRIRDVAVAKKFPDKLEIVINERVFWGVFCNRAQGSSTPACAYIDPDGIAYEYAPEPQGKLIISIRSDEGGDIILGMPAIDFAVMAEIRNLAEKIPAETGIAIMDFELRTRVPSEIRAIAGEGFAMIFKREDDYAAILRVLKRVLEGEIKDKQSRLDYIDLRFGNKVFYKLK